MPDHNHKHGAHVPHLHAPHLKDLVVSKAKARVLERSIAAAGRSLLATLTGDPYMPGSIRDGVANTFKTTVWPQVTEFLLDTLSDQTRVRPNLHREWPADCLTAAEGSRWERFRCVVLYAIFPADLSFWAKLRCPSLLSIYLLLLFPYYGVSLLMMLLLLLCIDWRCEYSLINYIVLIRALSFITVGLSWTAMVAPHAYTLCTWWWWWWWCAHQLRITSGRLPRIWGSTPTPNYLRQASQNLGKFPRIWGSTSSDSGKPA
jgi:hypothetical protein